MIAKGKGRTQIFCVFCFAVFLFTKIVKVEGKKTNLFEFYAETHPIFYKP